MKYRIPPGELGTGAPKSAGNLSSVLPTGCGSLLCFEESPAQQAEHSALPLHRRQLRQLSKGQYNSWRSTTRQEPRCAGTYVSEDGGFESWLRMWFQSGYNLSEGEIKELVPRANQAINTAGLLYQMYAKSGGRGSQSAQRAKLTGDNMVVRSPRAAAARMLDLTQSATSRLVQSDLMLEAVPPAAYDETSASNTGESSGQLCTHIHCFCIHHIVCFCSQPQAMKLC